MRNPQTLATRLLTKENSVPDQTFAAALHLMPKASARIGWTIGRPGRGAARHGAHSCSDQPLQRVHLRLQPRMPLRLCMQLVGQPSESITLAENKAGYSFQHDGGRLIGIQQCHLTYANDANNTAFTSKDESRA